MDPLARPGGLDQGLGQGVGLADAVEGGVDLLHLLAQCGLGEALEGGVVLKGVVEDQVFFPKPLQGVFHEGPGPLGLQGGKAPPGGAFGHQGLHQGQVQGGREEEHLLGQEAQSLPEALKPAFWESPFRHQKGGEPFLAALEGLGQLVPVGPGPLAFQKPEDAKLVKGAFPGQKEVAPGPHEGPQAHIGPLPARYLEKPGQVLGEADQVVLGGEVKGSVAGFLGRIPGDEVGLGGHHLRQKDPEVKPVQVVQLLGLQDL